MEQVNIHITHLLYITFVVDDFTYNHDVSCGQSHVLCAYVLWVFYCCMQKPHVEYVEWAIENSEE